MLAGKTGPQMGAATASVHGAGVGFACATVDRCPVAVWAVQASPERISASRGGASKGSRGACRYAPATAAASPKVRQWLAAGLADSGACGPPADGNEDPADDFGRFFARIPQIGKFGPRQYTAGAVMRVVEGYQMAVEPQEDAEMAQIGPEVEPMVQDHPGVAAEQLSEEFGGPFRLERHGRKTLPAGIQRESMGASGFHSTANLLGHPLPDGELFTGQTQRPIDHRERGCSTRSAAAESMLRLEGNRHHIAQFASERMLSAV